MLISFGRHSGMPVKGCTLCRLWFSLSLYASSTTFKAHEVQIASTRSVPMSVRNCS